MATKLSKAQLAVIDRIGNGDKIRLHHRSSVWRVLESGQYVAVRGVQRLVDEGEYVTRIFERGGFNLAVLTDKGRALYAARHAQEQAAPVAIDMTPELLAALHTVAFWELAADQTYSGLGAFWVALAEYVRRTAYAVEYEMTPYWRELDIVRQWDSDWLIVSPDFVAATDTDAYDLFRLVHVSAVKRVLTRERYWRTLTFEDRNVLDTYPELES